MAAAREAPDHLPTISIEIERGPKGALAQKRAFCSWMPTAWKLASVHHLLIGCCFLGFLLCRGGNRHQTMHYGHIHQNRSWFGCNRQWGLHRHHASAVIWRVLGLQKFHSTVQQGAPLQPPPPPYPPAATKVPAAPPPSTSPTHTLSPHPHPRVRTHFPVANTNGTRRGTSWTHDVPHRRYRRRRSRRKNNNASWPRRRRA
mmetsp:Transcript_2691/g.4812  ORF Transcript_2691/g.4812 Transcript_2691/m.4812 type:complete len:201 (-) Transcript_2691:154-756(-)